MREVSIGERLDQYQLTDVLARSGMASIFKATDSATGATVVLKIPHPQFESDVVFYERFRREEELGLRLEHPNIVRVLRPKEKSRMYIVMEFIAGKSLRVLMQETRPMATDTALGLVIQVCEALAYMHEHKVVHRDMKPENVLVTADGCAKVLDLGIAFDASTADVKAALVAMDDGYTTSDWAVTGVAGAWVVEFKGALAKTDVALMDSTDGGINARQTVAVTGGTAGDNVVLSYDGQSTAELAYDMTSADMQTALRALSSINGANVAVTDGNPSGWVVEFIGTLAHTDATAITGDGTNLVGDVKTVTVVETVKGNAATVNVAETVQGHLATVNITETVKGNLATVNVTETVQGHLATVSVTMTQQGDAGFTVTITKVADASDGSNYSWIAC